MVGAIAATYKKNEPRPILTKTEKGVKKNWLVKKIVIL